jgi:hypothetical protein
MPGVFMVGSGSLIAHGSEQNIEAILGEVESGWSGVEINYTDSEGTECSFDILLRDLVSGTFKIAGVSPTSAAVTFDGVTKSSIQGSALKDVLSATSDWKIAFVKGGYRSVSEFSDVSLDGVKLANKAPKQK